MDAAAPPDDAAEPTQLTAMRPARVPIVLRGVALAVALSVAAAGSGLPMCVSLGAGAAPPCDMHRGSQPTLVTGASVHSQGSPHNCHQDVPGLGCLGAGACPTADPGTPVRPAAPIVLRAAIRANVPEPTDALVSYLAPPLSPPPQA